MLKRELPIRDISYYGSEKVKSLLTYQKLLEQNMQAIKTTIFPGNNELDFTQKPALQYGSCAAQHRLMPIISPQKTAKLKCRNS